VLKDHKKHTEAPTDGERRSPESVARSLESQSHTNWLMLVVAGLISGFGVLVAVPPLVNPALAPHWAWATPHIMLIIVLTLSMLALVGLWHQQRYLAVMRERLDLFRVEIETDAKKDSVRLCALLDVTNLMAYDAGLEGVVDRITDTCASVFNCDHVSLMLYNERSETLVVRSVGGRLVNLSALGAQQKIGEGIAGWAAEKREALLLGQECDPTDYPGLQLNSLTIASAMVVPVVLNDELVGVINVGTQSKAFDYDVNDLRALQMFAENVGACIRSGQTYDTMRRTIHELEVAVRTQDKHTTAPAESR
jgi:putative methionine-R-sulfoxide reductase with GAF domain